MGDVGYASGVIVMAVTFTGEPGYSIYIPSEFALQVYDNLIKVGRDYGIRNVGQLAMRFLRVEKFIPFWALELTSDTTPNEVSRSFKVDFTKENFFGKKALMKQMDQGVYKRLVQLHLEDFDKDNEIWPWSGEAVYRNGEVVGHVTSTAYGFTLHKMIALGFVQHPTTRAPGEEMVTVEEDWIMDPAAKWTMCIAGKHFPVSVHVEPPPLPVIQQESVSAGKKSKKNYPTVQLLNARRDFRSIR